MTRAREREPEPEQERVADAKDKADATYITFKMKHVPDQPCGCECG